MASGNRDGHPYLYEHDVMTAQFFELKRIADQTLDLEVQRAKENYQLDRIKASENYSQALSKALTLHNEIVDAAVAEYRATLINIMPEEI